jgi:hypothetical protein
MKDSYWRSAAGLIDADAEHAYWRQRLRGLPYVDPDLATYDEYAAAFQFGWESWACYARWSHEQPRFFEVEQELAREWRCSLGAEGLPWQMARFPVRDVWKRMQSLTQRDR